MTRTSTVSTSFGTSGVCCAGRGRAGAHSISAAKATGFRIDRNKENPPGAEKIALPALTSLGDDRGFPAAIAHELRTMERTSEKPETFPGPCNRSQEVKNSDASAW